MPGKNVSIVLWSLRELSLESLAIEGLFPFCNDYRRNAVANDVDNGSSFRNESVHSKYQHQAGDRDARNRTQRGGQNNECTSADACGALRREQQNEHEGKFEIDPVQRTDLQLGLV